MGAKQKNKKKKKTLDDILNCNDKCSGYPYDCLECVKKPISIFRNLDVKGVNNGMGKITNNI